MLLLFPIKSDAIAWTDWGAQTPGGHTISDNWGPKALIVKDSFILSDLEEWYFYRNHVIGKFSSGYFIYNEGNSTLNIFNSVGDWKNQLHQNKLDPVLWTRWYSGDWDSISINDIFFVIILLTAFGLLLAIKNIKDYFNIRHPRILFICAIVLVIIVLKLKLSFPGSF